MFTFLLVNYRSYHYNVIIIIISFLSDSLTGLPEASQNIILQTRSATERNQTLMRLEWDEGFGATHYHILIDSSSNSNYSQHVTVNTTALTVSLPHNAEYSVYIWAANCNGNSSEPSIATITTGN